MIIIYRCLIRKYICLLRNSKESVKAIRQKEFNNHSPCDIKSPLLCLTNHESCQPVKIDAEITDLSSELQVITPCLISVIMSAPDLL